MEKIIGIYYPIEYDIKYNSTEYSTVLTYTLTAPMGMGGNSMVNQGFDITDYLYNRWNNKIISENILNGKLL